jgi:7-carboxy-7-deazaguanine synthase
MPQPHTLKISEIFPSIQGEGLRQGELTLFIRLAGCNLKCDFCDTKYAWISGQDMAVTRVLDKVKKIYNSFPTRWICLTGGEPLLQSVEGLVRRLKAEGFKIQVETNGTIYRRMAVNWYTVSPKSPEYFYQPEYRKKANEVKVIVTKSLNFGVLQRLRREFPEKTPLLLQPQSNRKWSGERAMKLLRQTLEANLNNIRLSVQIHKIFGWR